MSLAELLPAIRALSRAEKAELVQIVQGELASEAPAEVDLKALFPPGVVVHAGYGLYDKASFEGAAILYRFLEAERKKDEQPS